MHPRLIMTPFLGAIPAAALTGEMICSHEFLWRFPCFGPEGTALLWGAGPNTHHPGGHSTMTGAWLGFVWGLVTT